MLMSCHLETVRIGWVGRFCLPVKLTLDDGLVSTKLPDLEII